MSKFKRPAEILLVEDNPGDVELMREALRREGHNAHLHVTRDGEDALSYLYKRGTYSDALRPDIIMLDLALPKVSGKEVLQQVKSNPGLSDIPVIVLSGSDSQRDISEASDMHANCYVTKPMQFDEGMQTLQAILRFWLKIVQLPNSFS